MNKLSTEMEERQEWMEDEDWERFQDYMSDPVRARWYRLCCDRIMKAMLQPINHDEAYQDLLRNNVEDFVKPFRGEFFSPIEDDIVWAGKLPRHTTKEIN